MTEPRARLSADRIERVYRARPTQAGMLYHDLLDPRAAPYYRQISFDIAGTVDAGACEAAWNGLLDRHAMLRSAFDHERTDQPLQIVLKTERIDFHAETVSPADASRRIDAWKRNDAARGFDLTHDRLLRVALFHIGADRAEMVWSHPHILLDGWSGGIIAADFTALYAEALGKPHPALPPPVDPDEYMSAIAARDDSAADRHWATVLQGYDTLATLPRLPTDGLQAAEHRFGIDHGRTSRLRALANDHGTTLGVLLQALWGIILARWTGREDVVFGVVVSGRSVATPGIERLVGMFIGTVPVRVRWTPDDRLDDLLARLHDQAVQASAHDQVGLAAIQAASALPSGLLDHLLVLENYPAPPDHAGTSGFTVTDTRVSERANYDFGILVHEGSRLDFTLHHDAARMPPDVIERIAEHWRTLIDAVLDRPGRRLADLDPMPGDERDRIVALGHGPVAYRDEAATLADLWHAQVDRTPAAEALVAGDVRIDYRALDALAEGVAGRLRHQGITRGDVVGLLTRRGADRIAGLLGILKAGATYLPISTALPDRRISDMVRDAGARLVLADAHGLARLHAGVAAAPVAGPPAWRRLATNARPNDTAYIIYTSGSTGGSKGVAVPHRGFVNMILAQIQGFGILPEDRVLQFASCSFDASLSEIFMALLTGASLVIAPDASIQDGGRLLTLLEDEQVTVATLPPSYLGALDRPSLATLRLLITAGEPPNIADSRHHARSMTLFNAYGPTEASVCAAWHRVDPADCYPAGIPIGRAIANTAMSIRDDHGRPMPTGATGEVWLSGAGLAAGYVGRPDLTARQFPVIGGVRFYRTGDAGLMRADGETLYLGRIDAQVKLGGRRVEPGEIEERLLQHPDIVQAAVVVAGDPARLAAFVVPRRRPPDAQAVLRDLADVLPAWMVPARLTVLDALPITLAGKIDRRALAAPDSAPPPAPGRSLDAIEQHVADAFTVVLGGGPVGSDASFSALGGDSLRAIRLLGRLRRSGLTIELRDLLAADAVAAIARAVRPVVVTDDRPTIGTVPLTPAQHWYFAGDLAGQARFGHRHLLETGRSIDPAVVKVAIDAIWRRHEALRLRFRHDVTWHAEVSPPTPTAPVRLIDLRHAPTARQSLRADATAQAPGDAASGAPLFAATHYRLASGDALLLTAHHLAVDAHSWRVLVEDLGHALEQAEQRQPVRLPAATAGFAEWSRALNGEAARAAAEAERPHWQAIAEAMPDATLTPHSYDDTETLSADLGPIAIGMTERSTLAELLRRLGHALAALHGIHSTVVMLTGHGRRAIGSSLDVSRSVGWFSADYPVLLDCTANRQTLDTMLATIPSAGVGWSILRWLSGDPPTLAEPAVSVNYIGDIGPSPDDNLTIGDDIAGVVTTGLPRRRRIELEAYAAEGRLRLDLRYAPRLDPPDKMRALLNAIAHAGAAPLTETPLYLMGEDA